MVSTRSTDESNAPAKGKKTTTTNRRQRTPPRPKAAETKPTTPPRHPRSGSGRGAVSSSAASGSSVASTASSTASTRRGLPLFVIKTLATDIQRETNGKGPTALQGPKALQKLCDKKKKIYGETGSTSRRQISNLVDKWKAFPKDKYNSRVLLKFGVAVHPEAASEQEQLANSEPPADEGLTDEEDKGDHLPVPSEITTTSKNPKPAAAKPKSATKKAPPLTKKATATPEVSSPPAIKKKTTTANMSTASTFLGSPLRFVRASDQSKNGNDGKYQDTSSCLCVDSILNQ